MSAFQNQIGEAVVTPAARIAFPSLDKPDVGRQYSDEKYKATLIFDPETTDFSEMKRVCNDLAEQAFGKGVTLDQIDLHPFKDGNEKEKWQGFEGNIYITAKSKFPVACFNAGKEPIPPKSVYAGCLARAFISPFAFMMGRQKGITFLLQFVQFLEDRPRFGGVGDVDPEDVFGAWEGGSTQVADALDTPVAESNGEDTPASPPKTSKSGKGKGRGRPKKQEETPANGAQTAQSGGSLLEMI